MRILLINVKSDSVGGREQFSAMLMLGLRKVAGEGFNVVQLLRNRHKTSVTERFYGRIDGVTSAIERKLRHQLLDAPPDCVVLDGSNLGRLARLIKHENSSIPVITFYHNVEARFFLDLFRSYPSFRSVGVLLANFLTERWATLYSDRRVMLNERDSNLLRSIYGRRGTDVLPMAIRDLYDPAATLRTRPIKEKYALFVGGSFYANVEGMAWYAEKIAPNSPLLTVVIGRGMEAHRTRLEQWGGVRVLGSVDDLASWYAHAQIAVAPILSGSGMKTKTAEALMHGKPIAGTPEAFVGYDLTSSDGLKLCETPNDFLDALQSAGSVEASVDPQLRNEYLQHHSEKAMRDHLKHILQIVSEK